MTTIEKLNKISELLEDVFYDLEFCENIDLTVKRSASVAEDLVKDVINYLKDK